jgi:hypothetical protein
MSVEQDFLPFAAAGGANVISQSAYAALAALGPGFSTGVAASDQLNKVWRQSSIMAAVIGNLIADVTNNPVIDDGTTATILQNLYESMLLAGFGFDTGAANAYTVTLVPAISSATPDGTVVRFRPAHTNTGASTLSVNGSSAAVILGQNYGALTGGEILVDGDVEVVWHSDRSAWCLMSNLGGVFQGATQAIAHVTSSGTIAYQSGRIKLSVTHSGTGIYSVTFGTALPSASYVPQVTITTTGSYSGNCYTLTTGGLVVETFNTGGGPGSNTDLDFALAIFY